MEGIQLKTVLGFVLLLASVGFSRQLDLGQIFGGNVNDAEDAMEIMRILGKPRTVSPKYLGFSWSDCGSSSSLVNIDSLTVSPDPINVPGNLSVSFSAVVSDNLPSTIEADLTVEKKIGFLWIKIPCIEHIGSCSIDNVCSAKLPCPSVFAKYGIPCQCPIKKGTYKLPQSPVYVNVSSVPSGEYRVEAKLRSQNTDIGCVKVGLSIG